MISYLTIENVYVVQEVIKNTLYNTGSTFTKY